MGDVIVRVVDLPTHKIGATVKEDENGDYNVYINSRYGCIGQHKAFDHEMDHIKHDDFRNGIQLSICEARARRAAGQ